MFTTFHGTQISAAACRFFFIFCPNNSGKTILSQYLAAQLDAYLPPRGNNEGQGLPAVRQMMRTRPWNPDQPFDWPHIRQAWETAAQGRTFVEASPPNLMRAAAISAHFGPDSTALLSICSPHQQIASSLKRYKRPGTKVGGMVDHWVMKAQRIDDISKTYPQFPLIRYEDFVTSPQRVNTALNLAPVDFAGVGKRGSGASGVEDLAIRTTLFLNPEEIDAISTRLARG